MKNVCRVLGYIIMAAGIIISIVLSSMFGENPNISNTVLFTGIIVTLVFSVGFLVAGTIIDSLEKLNHTNEQILMKICEEKEETKDIEVQ